MVSLQVHPDHVSMTEDWRQKLPETGGESGRSTSPASARNMALGKQRRVRLTLLFVKRKQQTCSMLFRNHLPVLAAQRTFQRPKQVQTHVATCLLDFDIRGYRT